LHNLEHRLLASSSAIHVLSQFSRSCVEQFHGMGSKVTVIPHWRRPDLYRTVTKSQARVALGWPQQEKILLTVRRLAVRMGLDVALEALVPLAAAGRCVFMVGGEGPLRSVLEAQARAAGVGPDRIRFLGRLPEERLKLAYQAADVFLLPTRALEGFGLITVEALAFGCPVIGTDAGSTPEILDPILPGMIVPAGNIEALREKVSEFLEGRLALPDAQEIAQYVASRYDPLVVLPRFYTLLEG
jgi:glycosyltransferase involved in cell wall biosynthesis